MTVNLSRAPSGFALNRYRHAARHPEDVSNFQADKRVSEKRGTISKSMNS
jgi:hypothetical protein